MQTIGVLSNFKKSGVIAEEKKIVAWLKSEKAEVMMPKHPYNVVDQKFLHNYLSAAAPNLDALLVLGGDGTLLSVARQASVFDIPLLGINMGRVGFLAELELGEHLYASLKRLLNDDYFLENRMMLEMNVLRDGKNVANFHCLNDGVVLRHNFSGLVKTMVFIDDKLSVCYHGDGIAVATPTGASGYSLSANGPLVSPELRAIIITPICPQSLYSRPMVVGDHRKISLQIADIDGDSFLSIDGKTDTYPLEIGDRIDFSVSPMETKLIRLNGKTFFDVLNEKLRARK